MRKISYVTVMLATGFVATTAFAASSKSDYTLFLPTPRDKMRDMSTDRPDKTESPYTVDAGHIQIESDLISYTRDHSKAGGGDTVTNSFNTPTINFKVGLTNSSDIQFVYDSYNYSRVEDKQAGTTETTDGLGDLTIRYKYNFWGNDGGDTAFGIMPFIKFPTSRNSVGNDSFEGGVIVPFGMELAEGVGFGTMAELDISRDEDDHGYHATYIASATIGYDVTDALGHYVELYAEKADESGAKTIVTFDTGLTYGVTDNLQLDAGVNIGVTKAADDLNPFLGVSYRY